MIHIAAAAVVAVVVRQAAALAKVKCIARYETAYGMLAYF